MHGVFDLRLIRYICYSADGATAKLPHSIIESLGIQIAKQHASPGIDEPSYDCLADPGCCPCNNCALAGQTIHIFNLALLVPVSPSKTPAMAGRYGCWVLGRKGRKGWRAS